MSKCKGTSLPASHTRGSTPSLRELTQDSNVSNSHNWKQSTSRALQRHPCPLDQGSNLQSETLSFSAAHTRLNISKYLSPPFLTWSDPLRPHRYRRFSQERVESILPMQSASPRQLTALHTPVSMAYFLPFLIENNWYRSLRREYIFPPTPVVLGPGIYNSREGSLDGTDPRRKLE
ncbi:hypothetical protein RRG08_009507 [Elysia crispata]|uniref:Uncharacterized protein n=1 Tax=Elysia crispata TaxID=231223 RepID=A0AAE1B1Z5_9GAST|nr:hypothetical protein RRG08_009507 [Elysia crispata]